MPRLAFSHARPSSTRIVCTVLTTCTLLLLGCGPSPPNVVPVQGKILLDGKPMSLKSVLFVPHGETGGNGAGGYSDPDGNYKLVAVINGATEDYEGCPPGQYKVVVFEPTIPITADDFASLGTNQSEDPNEPAAAIGPPTTPEPKEIPKIYTSAETSTLIVEVPEEGGTLDLNLDASH